MHFEFLTRAWVAKELPVRLNLTRRSARGVLNPGPWRCTFSSPHHAALRASRIFLGWSGGGRTQPRPYASPDSDRLSPKAPDQPREIRRMLDGLKKVHRHGPSTLA